MEPAVMNSGNETNSGSWEVTGGELRSHQRVDKYGKVGIIIGLFVSIFILICFVLTSYLCIRANRNREVRSIKIKDEEAGLDDAVLKSWQKVTYGGAKFRLPVGQDGASSCCSVCLVDFRNDDEIRQLPQCGHFFHAQCIDPWLRKQSTCPLCRSAVRRPLESI